jgi:prepilin-type N-terminal cleavage/methylation domain-containing protein
MMRRNGQQGMTLLEVMVSMALMVGMLTLGWSTFSNGLTIKRMSEEGDERYHEIRVAMSRMVDDLSSAHISANEDKNLQERRTLFIGKDTSDVNELRFSSMAHRVLWADANESEQTLIAYYAEDDVEDSGKTNLIRRESRRLSNEQWRSEPAEIDVLLRDIKKVEFEYYDWREKEWRETWDTTKADGQQGRLPSRVRVTIELKNANDDDFKFTTQARLMLQEELQFFTN